MEFTEEQVMEALGMEPEALSAREQTDMAQSGMATQGDGIPPESERAGAPDAPPLPEGENGGTPPAPEQEQNAPEGAQPPDVGDGEQPAPAQEQGPEVPVWVLEARNRARQQAAFEQAVQEVRRQAYEEARKAQEEELRGFFAQAGLRDPYSDTPITTMEQYRDYMARSRMEQLNRDLAQGKLTPEGLNEAIRLAMAQQGQGDSAQQQAAKPNGAPAQTQPAPAARPEEQPDTGRDKARIEAEVAEIARMDPAVKEMGDLLRQPWSREFYQFVQEGHSFLGAYHRAVSGAQAKQAAEAARQKAIDQVHSKDHLTAGAAPQGGGMDAVPPEDMKYFRLFMPDASDEEIQKYYNRARGKGKA